MKVRQPLIEWIIRLGNIELHVQGYGGFGMINHTK